MYYVKCDCGDADLAAAPLQRFCDDFDIQMLTASRTQKQLSVAEPRRKCCGHASNELTAKRNRREGVN